MPPANPNQENNAKALGILHNRAAKFPRSLAYPMAAFASASHAVIEELWDRTKGCPLFISEGFGDLSSDQFVRLYRGTIWSFVGLCTWDSIDIDERLLFETCEVFVGSLDMEPNIAQCVMDVVPTNGDRGIVAAAVLRHYRSVLNLPVGEIDILTGTFFWTYYNSAFDRARLLIVQEAIR
jgi:hypothetical protein